MPAKVDKSDRWIDDIVGALFDPIIVTPGGWGDDLPEWIKPQITIERLAENMLAIKQGRELTATDAEAVAYLFTASLTAPIDSDWTQIYLYIAGKVMQRNKKIEMPADIKVDSISDYQMGKLTHLKQWIYDTRVEHRKEKTRLEHQEQKKAEAKEELILQPKMFEF